MSSHEIKYCPRCLKPFECKPGNITQCQCFEVKLTSKELEFIKEMYDDCLCVDCLKELQNRFRKFKDTVKLEFIKKHIGEINGFRN